jgi:hypothetical protein
MIKTGEEILADIDATLDQLIRNAETVRTAPIQTLEETEIIAMQKTQESLLAHLLHMDQLLKSNEKKQMVHSESKDSLREKIAHFSRLNTLLLNDVALKFNVDVRRSKKKKCKP